MRTIHIKNWRTTLSGLCAAICYFFHDEDGLAHWAKTLIKLAGAVGVFLCGLAAVDSKQMSEAIDEGTRHYRLRNYAKRPKDR